MAQSTKPVSGPPTFESQEPVQSGKHGNRTYARQQTGTTISPPLAITRSAISPVFMEDLKRRWSKGSPNPDDQKERERAKSCSPTISSPEEIGWEEIYDSSIFNNEAEFKDAVEHARQVNCSDSGLQVIYNQIVAAGLLVKSCDLKPQQAVQQCLNKETLKRLGDHKMRTLKAQLEQIKRAISRRT